MTNSSFHQWLAANLNAAEFNIIPLAGDASFRRYFRVIQANKSWIAMDASAEKEKCPQFIAIANALRKKELLAPHINAQDLSKGFLLLTDFGDDILLKTLNVNNAELWYQQALITLSVLSTIDDYPAPIFTRELMREEMNGFQEWFLENYLRLELSTSTLTMLAQTFDKLVQECAAQPYVFMHRDFHSANLMVLPDHRLGLLDFQDAFMGPVTYDLASLLRDCYIDWPDELIKKCVLDYRNMKKLTVSEEQFLRWFDWMGMQRHLKALMTFSRKYRRDHNDNYLQHIPRTLNYILRVSERYPEFAALNAFLNNNVMEQLACVQ
jgi:aminoglycoside/choline kinase family phosphotransferase